MVWLLSPHLFLIITLFKFQLCFPKDNANAFNQVYKPFQIFFGGFIDWKNWLEKVLSNLFLAILHNNWHSTKTFWIDISFWAYRSASISKNWRSVKINTQIKTIYFIIARFAAKNLHHILNKVLIECI